ncbi:hypothetical protein [Novibacillus thermophilus]|nr:hypothetical protein [Novibacillus thermophilus]
MEQVKVQGERWFPSETRFSDEAKALWGIGTAILKSGVSGQS